MEFENLVKLIETVSASGLTGFQYEEKGMKIKLSKDVSGGAQVVSATDAKEQSIQSAAVLKTQETQSISVTETEGISAQPDGKLIRSPLVGTF